MKTLDGYIQSRAKRDPEFKKAYDELRPERDLQIAIIAARTERGMTQQELSEKTGIPQPDISRIENGTYNPSLKLLQRLATGMNMRVKIELVAK